MLSDFSGQLQFEYQESELNGLNEAELSLAISNATGMWLGYVPDIDTNVNRLTYTFNTAATFSKVTADFNSALNVDNPQIMAAISIYPNPTASVVYIKYAYPVKTTVYNMIGQVIQTGNSHQVDLSLYEEATYLLQVQDQNSNASKLFKVIKK
ncbi:T9SS type A sorting domain-containing protein [Bizionia sediminis]|uniref:T9SS type A sorting domain-containing protein n=1 Tax=Bizionia sediminis TaxID=1737064 RepID=A0ABW5KPZ5_9FLAO